MQENRNPRLFREMTPDVQLYTEIESSKSTTWRLVKKQVSHMSDSQTSSFQEASVSQIVAGQPEWFSSVKVGNRRVRQGAGLFAAATMTSLELSV